MLITIATLVARNSFLRDRTIRLSLILLKPKTTLIIQLGPFTVIPINDSQDS